MIAHRSLDSKMDPSPLKNPIYKVTRLNERFKPANDNRIPKSLIVKRIVFCMFLILGALAYYYL